MWSEPFLFIQTALVNYAPGQSYRCLTFVNLFLMSCCRFNSGEALQVAMFRENRGILLHSSVCVFHTKILFLQNCVDIFLFIHNGEKKVLRCINISIHQWVLNNELTGTSSSFFVVFPSGTFILTVQLMAFTCVPGSTCTRACQLFVWFLRTERINNTIYLCVCVLIICQLPFLFLQTKKQYLEKKWRDTKFDLAILFYSLESSSLERNCAAHFAHCSLFWHSFVSFSKIKDKQLLQEK